MNLTPPKGDISASSSDSSWRCMVSIGRQATGRALWFKCDGATCYFQYANKWMFHTITCKRLQFWPKGTHIGMPIFTFNSSPFHTVHDWNTAPPKGCITYMIMMRKSTPNLVSWISATVVTNNLHQLTKQISLELIRCWTFNHPSYS